MKDHPAVKRLAAEAEASADLDQVQVKDRTLRQVELALADAVEDDLVFARHLDRVLAELHAAELASGRQPGTGAVIATGSGAAAVGRNTGIVSTGAGAVNTQRL